MIGKGGAGLGPEAALPRAAIGRHAFALLLTLLLHLGLVASFRVPQLPPEADDAFPARPPVIWIAPLRLQMPVHEHSAPVDGSGVPATSAPIASRPGTAPSPVVATPKPGAGLPAAGARGPRGTRSAGSPPAPMESNTPVGAQEPNAAAPAPIAGRPVPAAVSEAPSFASGTPDVAAAGDKAAGSPRFDLEAARKTARKLATAKWTKDEPAVAQLRDKPLYPWPEGTPLGRAIEAQ